MGMTTPIHPVGTVVQSVRTPRSPVRMASAVIALLALMIALLLLTGCSTGGSGGVSLSALSPSPAVVEQSPSATMVLAEAIIEGPSTDSDGRAMIGQEELIFVGRVAQDFSQIHAVATMNGDEELAVIAAWALVCLAPEHEQSTGWHLLASTIEHADDGLAVALAAQRQEFVRWLEDNQRRGLQPGSVAWRDACIRRATRIAGESATRYSNAKGFWNDNEQQIAEAMIGMRESYDLMAPNGLSVSQAMELRRLIGRYEAELYESQARSANDAYDNQVAHGQRRLEIMMRRLRSALEYTQHRTGPSYGQVDIEMISMGGGR